MSGIEVANAWISVVMWSGFAFVALLWAVIFCLHGVGRWKGKKGAFPSPQFWETFPKWYSKLIAAGLVIVSIFFAFSALGKMQSLRYAESDDIFWNDSKHDIEQHFQDMFQTLASMVEESHDQAVQRGMLKEWADSVIGGMKDDPGFFAVILPYVSPDVQSDLLYCLQETSGLNFNAQLGIEQNAEVLESNLSRVRKAFPVD